MNLTQLQTIARDVFALAIADGTATRQQADAVLAGLGVAGAVLTDADGRLLNDDGIVWVMGERDRLGEAVVDLLTVLD